MFTKVLFPASLPTIFVGLRLGLIFCLINIVGVEFLINFGGLGQVINDLAERYDLPGMYAAISASSSSSACCSSSQPSGSSACCDRSHEPVERICRSASRETSALRACGDDRCRMGAAVGFGPASIVTSYHLGLRIAMAFGRLLASADFYAQRRPSRLPRSRRRSPSAAPSASASAS